ncbi:MAG TPA: ABC transporter ATP-binding protein [Methylomirabilota bacterium]|jgi:iron complex transport system ATP-binding protein|nr:ABC transporter ATP-binding protein [Methylomirabilota bacterium]
MTARAREPLVEFRDVGFAYRQAARAGGRRFAFEGLSFSVEAGEVFGVIGPNSAGKTSLLRLLTRVLAPVRGSILIDGRAVLDMPHWELARQIAVVPQETPRPFPFSVEQLVLMGRYPHAPTRFFETAADRAAARDAMAATGTLALASLPLETLSGGERQRAMLARALAQEPRLLVLDEPTSHLDLRYQAETAELLRRLNRDRGVTVLLVSHDLNLAAELCDRLLLLAAGRVAGLGTPAEVLEAPRLERVFGCHLVVDKSASGRPTVQLAWGPPR